MSWQIVVSGGNLSFSAAHFITMEGMHETLHGHNYDVSATLTGEMLTEDSYLLDFGVVKAILRTLIAKVNHRFLLPLRNPHIMITDHGTEWELQLRDGERFILPLSSVIALDFDNATAERLAEYFANQLRHELQERGVVTIESIMVGVAETAMQTAYHTIRVVPQR